MGKVDTTCAAKHDIWVSQIGKSSEWIYKFPTNGLMTIPGCLGDCPEMVNRRRFEKTVFWPWDMGGLRGNGEYQSWLSLESWGPCARHFFCPGTQNGELDQFNSPNRITMVKPKLYSWDVGCSWMFGFLMSSDHPPNFLETYRFWYVSSSPQLKTMNPPPATPYCLQSGSFWARTPQGDLVRLGLRAFPFWLTFSSGINPTNNGESLSTTNNYE